MRKVAWFIFTSLLLVYSLPLPTATSRINILMYRVDDTPRQKSARLLWENLTAAQVNSSFPYTKKGSSFYTDEVEATFLAGAILTSQTGNRSYLEKADELCEWLNRTAKKNLFYSYDTAHKRWQILGGTSYAAQKLAELAIHANLSQQWKPLLQDITSTFIRRYVSSTSRVYSSVQYNDYLGFTISGTHPTSDAVIALTLAADVLKNDTIKNVAYQLIMNYTLGTTRLPYHQITQNGLPYSAYCKEDETFGLYTLAMETYYHYFPCDNIKERIRIVVQSAYHYLWNPEEQRWNYRVHADTGNVIAATAVHGFGYTDEAFLQAYLIWKNNTWLSRTKSDMDRMVLEGAIIFNGLIAHSTSGWQYDANDHWNVGARRTLILFYNLNYTKFFHNASYLQHANQQFRNSTLAHQRSNGWQVSVYLANYSDFEPKNTRIQFHTWLQYVNRTNPPIDTLKDLYRFFGVPGFGNVMVHSYLHKVTISSSPTTGIAFAINGTIKTTPYSAWMLEGSYLLEMPETYHKYIWSHWLEDGDLNRIKTVTLPGSTYTAVYRTPEIGGNSVSIRISYTPWIASMLILISAVVTAGLYVKHKKTK